MPWCLLPSWYALCEPRIKILEMRKDLLKGPESALRNGTLLGEAPACGLQHKPEHPCLVFDAHGGEWSNGLSLSCGLAKSVRGDKDIVTR